MPFKIVSQISSGFISMELCLAYARATRFIKDISLEDDFLMNGLVESEYA